MMMKSRKKKICHLILRERFVVFDIKKEIFSYLKLKKRFGVCYQKDSLFEIKKKFWSVLCGGHTHFQKTKMRSHKTHAPQNRKKKASTFGR